MWIQLKVYANKPYFIGWGGLCGLQFVWDKSIRDSFIILAGLELKNIFHQKWIYMDLESDQWWQNFPKSNCMEWWGRLLGDQIVRGEI